MARRDPPILARGLISTRVHNADLAEVPWEQREIEGEPLFPDSQDPARIPVRRLRRNTAFARDP